MLGWYPNNSENWKGFFVKSHEVKVLKRILLLTLFLVACSGNTKYSLLDGGTIDVKAPGKVLIINYWAIWCAPCRKEIPELNELASHHKEELMVVGVNFDGSQDELLENEIQKLGIEFSSLLDDPRNVWSLEPVSVLPETLIIGPDGKLQHRLIGPQTLSSIEALL